MNLMLDLVTHDLALSAGQLRLTDDGTDLSQKIKTRLLLVKGEWYLNPELGVPYFEEVFKKAPDLGKIKALFVSEITAVPGVEKIAAFDARLDTATRTYILDFTVKSSVGLVTVNGMEI